MRTDRHDEAVVVFRNLANARKKSKTRSLHQCYLFMSYLPLLIAPNIASNHIKMISEY